MSNTTQESSAFIEVAGGDPHLSKQVVLNKLKARLPNLRLA